MPRATTAAWEVMPPRAVRMPSAAFMPRMSSGEVSIRTRMTFSPAFAFSSASSAENTTRPTAAPGDAGRPRAITLRSAVGSRVGCSSWSREFGVDAQDRLLARDQPLLRHVDGDLHRGRGGALAGAGLQHPQAATFDRELDVLHVAVVLLERFVDPYELLEGRRHLALEGREVLRVRAATRLVDRLRRAHARDHVLALGVLQVLAVEVLLARGRVAREGHAGGAVVAHVAEDHRLDVDGGAPAGGVGVLVAIDDRAWGSSSW